jgi:hypothetical protein
VTSIERLVGLLEDVTSATARYGARDDRGTSLDTLKVIDAPGGGYLGVYHSAYRGPAGRGFAVYLATSTDLLRWTRRAELDDAASQPTITALSTGGFLVAVEAGGAGRPAWLRLHHYPTVARLLAGDADRSVDLPHTLVPPDALAEGTPNFYATVLAPDLDHSRLDLGFHYFRDGDVDRQARGELVDFRDWRARARPELDESVRPWRVAGNIGGRDALEWYGRPVTVLEGQSTKADWSSWRIYLRDEVTGQTTRLRIRTHRGSTSFGNPSVSLLRGPSGTTRLFASMFLFGQGAAAGEGGQLLYHHEIVPHLPTRPEPIQ